MSQPKIEARRLYVATPTLDLPAGKAALGSGNVLTEAPPPAGLDDLCVRFIINLPQEICRRWRGYASKLRRPSGSTRISSALWTRRSRPCPSVSFCLRIFQHCPLLASFSVENHMRAFEEFLQYKTRVPVRGAILLNDAMDATVLVKGWKKGASWSFPRGKINKDEDDLDLRRPGGCTKRQASTSETPAWSPPPTRLSSSTSPCGSSRCACTCSAASPTDTHFEPKTRKEISKIQWYRLSELPAFRKKGTNGQQDAAAPANAKKFYMVAPFLVPLKKWVGQQKKKDALRAETHALHAAHDDLLTEDDIGAQTEPATEMARITPAIDTLEGATKELRRLLKVQPATQGLQAPAPAADPARDKGEALLAILQRSAGWASQLADSPARDASRHTPLELTYTEAPEPRTPHHHHPTQRMPLDQYPPPPAFPMQPRATQNRPAGMYNSYQYTQQTAAPPPPAAAPTATERQAPGQRLTPTAPPGHSASHAPPASATPGAESTAHQRYFRLTQRARFRRGPHYANKRRHAVRCSTSSHAAAAARQQQAPAVRVEQPRSVTAQRLQD